MVVAAQAGLTGHLKLGKGARIGAQAGVMADVAAGADVVGSPAEPVRDFFRGVATLRKLARRPKNCRPAVVGIDRMDGTQSSKDATRTDDVLDIARIMHAIPHRYPMLMIDRVGGHGARPVGGRASRTSPPTRTSSRAISRAIR